MFVFDHEGWAKATQKRVKEGREYNKWRRKKAMEGYRCYLAYMKIRKKL